MPRIVYTNLLEAWGYFGYYDPDAHILILDEGFLQLDPRLGAPTFAHELSHRARRHWTQSIYEEYQAHYIQQQVGQELEIGPEMATTAFGQQVLKKHYEITQAVEQFTSGSMYKSGTKTASCHLMVRICGMLLTPILEATGGDWDLENGFN